MLAGNVGRVFALGIILTVVCAGVYAQQTVYKWVDKDGVVHFSDAPPDDAEAVETKTLTTAPPAAGVPPLSLSSKRPRLLKQMAKNN